MKIPVVNLKPALDAAAARWNANLESMFARMQFILGEQVAAFEQEFAAAMRARFAVGVATGTAAIELCLRDAGITRPSQEVLTSALTAPFTGIAILAAGGSPRFADIDPETLLMDPDDAANRATAQTAAIVPVHLYGQPAAIDRFAKLAKEREWVVVQDACQAHGAHFRNRPFTQFSQYVCYSFYPTKNLGCLGDGGAIVTGSANVNRRLRMLRDGGRRNTEQVARMAGINARLDEMQACFLRAFLPDLEKWNAHRARIASRYDEILRDCPGVTLPRRSGDGVCHLYVIRAERRDKLRAALAAQGIGTGIHYPVPLHRMPAFGGAKLRRGDLPHAEKACREVVSLPVWPGMPDEDACRVGESIRRFYR